MCEWRPIQLLLLSMIEEPAMMTNTVVYHVIKGVDLLASYAHSLYFSIINYSHA